MDEDVKVYGIQETKDVLDCAFSAIKAAMDAKSDGKVSLGDLPKLMEPLSKLPAAINGMSFIPGELTHLDEAERAEIISWAKEKLDLGDDHAEGAIVDGLNLVASIEAYVQKYFIKA